MVNRSEFKSFPSKLLLFGEYTVILGGSALAMPLNNYGGKLELLDTYSLNNIAPFIQYLGALHHLDLNQELIENMELDCLVFKSNIPIGYGAGSSGALSAAVYDAFVLNKKKDLDELQDHLASMEDFFHGSSSGIDPLIAYTGKTVLNTQEHNEPAVIGLSSKKILRRFYLIDTGISRKTGPFVDLFKEKMKQDDFSMKIENELLPLNEKAISALLEGDLSSLERCLSQISNHQNSLFSEMIPDQFKRVWEASLLDDSLHLKLCGAGGGGFLLMYAAQEENLGAFVKKHNINVIELSFD